MGPCTGIFNPCLIYPNYVDQPRYMLYLLPGKKVQVGKDREKAQSEKVSHSKNRGGKKLN